MSQSVIHQPMDKLFKHAMSDVRVAKEFFMRHLSAEVKARIDFNTLKFHKESFIDEEYQASAADVVYSALFDGHVGYLYCLVEHQSTPDAWLPLRIMNYLLKLLTYHQKQVGTLPLPIVVPLIVYNGQAAYADSTAFFDLFGSEAQVMKNILVAPFPLIDVKKIDDETLSQHIWSGAMEFLLKHQYQRNFLTVAETFFALLHELELQQGQEYAKSLIYYIINQTEGETVQNLIELAKQYLSPKLNEDTMTFAQQLKKEGLEEGIKVGIQQGISQGIQQGISQGIKEGRHSGLMEGKQLGEAAAFMSLLESKFSSIDSNYLNQIKYADEATLLHWIKKVLTAQRIEDIFQD